MNKNEQKNKEDLNNAFNNLKHYYNLMIIGLSYVLYLSAREMLGFSSDKASNIAGVTTVLLIITIYRYLKNNVRY